MKKSKLGEFITTNTWLKLASLVFATLLWFFVVSEGRSVITMDVPIRFKNIPDKLEVVDSRKKIRVSIEGQERFLAKLREKDIRVVINLSGVNEGETSFSMSADNVILPKAFTVTKILPQTVKILLKEK